MGHVLPAPVTAHLFTAAAVVAQGRSQDGHMRGNEHGWGFGYGWGSGILILVLIVLAAAYFMRKK
jgi:hypothetical protein